MSQERKGKQRPVEGSAHAVYKKLLYEDATDGVRELLANAMTWTYVANVPPEERKIYLTLNAERTRDFIAEDPGLGIFPHKWLKFTTMGHTPDEQEHTQRMLDPDYISQIGIGINSYLSLSECEDVEFRSVTIDEEGKKTGLIGKMWSKAGDENAPIFMDEHPWTGDPKEALNHRGTKVIIKDLIKDKKLTKERIKDYLSKTFALKLRDYQVFIKDDNTDIEYERILPSREFCTKHMVDLFQLSDGTIVRGDIHPIEKADKETKMAIRMCVKKVKMADLEGQDKVEFLAHGIITTNSPNVKFQANRSGFRKQLGSLYEEMEAKLKQWMTDNGFKKPDQPREEKVDDASTIREVVGQAILKLATDEKYKDIMLRLAGSFTKLGIPGRTNGLEQEGQSEEWEDYAKDQLRVLTDKKQEGKFKREPPIDGPPIERPPRDKDITPKKHHGPAPGGTNTWQQPVTKDNPNKQALIMPDIPPVTYRGDTPSPVSEVAEINGYLKWKINLANKTGSKAAEAKRTKDSSLIKACFNKAFTDYISKLEGWTWEQSSELWEFLMAEKHNGQRGRQK